MKTLIFIPLLFLVQNLSAQLPGQQYSIPEFGWTIEIPERADVVDAGTWEKRQVSGAQIIGDHVNEDLSESVEINETFFVVSNGEYNILEVSKQPYDIVTDGDPDETNKVIGNLLAESLRARLPEAEITTKYGTEEIGGKMFYKTTLVAKYGKGLQNVVYMYNRVFGKTEFCINVSYINPLQGKILLDAVKSSTFN